MARDGERFLIADRCYLIASEPKMIRNAQKIEHTSEPQTGQPAASGEGWLGRNQSEKRRLWERLNPRHRKELRMLAEALALQQNHAQLPPAARARLDTALAELDRVIRRIAGILAELARRTPPAG
jgi:hypothetical protein